MGFKHTSRFTEKQRLFCREFIVDLNMKQAAIRAGYSKKSADIIGSENMAKPSIRAEVARLLAARNERVEVDADYVLQRFVEIDTMDINDILGPDGEVLPIPSWPRVWRQSVSGVDIEELIGGHGDARSRIGLLKKIKWPDKMKALELMGRHVNVNAFKEVHEHTGPGGGPIRTISTDMTPQEAAEAYAATLDEA